MIDMDDYAETVQRDGGASPYHMHSFPTSPMEEGKKLFVSYRLKGEYEKPWLSNPKMRRTQQNNWIVYGFIGAGVALAGVVAWLIIRPAISGPVSSKTTQLSCLCVGTALTGGH